MIILSELDFRKILGSYVLVKAKIEKIIDMHYRSSDQNTIFQLKKFYLVNVKLLSKTVFSVNRSLSPY